MNKKLKPTQRYLKNCFKVENLSPIDRKLIILDLNGTLLKKTKSKSFVVRPYFEQFKDYLFDNDWNIIIFSSSTYRNVSLMLEKLFSDEEQRKYILDVFCREDLDLSDEDFHKKVEHTKNLRTIWDIYTEFNQFNSLIVDDSSFKSQLQPYNFYIIKPYEKTYNEFGYDEDEELYKLKNFLIHLTFSNCNNYSNFLMNSNF